MMITDVLAAVFRSVVVKRRGTRFEAVPLHLSWRNQQRERRTVPREDERMNERRATNGRMRWSWREKGVSGRGRNVAEPVFERSGESGGYTFTDLHYPGFVPTPSDTHP